MYVYIYIHIDTCIHMCIYIDTYMSTCIYVYLNIYVSPTTCVHMAKACAPLRGAEHMNACPSTHCAILYFPQATTRDRVSSGRWKNATNISEPMAFFIVFRTCNVSPSNKTYIMIVTSWHRWHSQTQMHVVHERTTGPQHRIV